MKLWSIQPLTRWIRLLDQGVLQTRRSDSEYSEYPAFEWMSRKMEEVIGPPPLQGMLPVWAWYQFEGRSKPRPDLRTSGFLERGTRGVRITLEVSEQSVLLSDFELWHYVWNQEFLPDTPFKVESGLLFDPSGQPLVPDGPKVSREEIEQSWLKCLDLDWYCEGVAVPREKKSIQATLWELRLEAVVEVKKFVAR